MIKNIKFLHLLTTTLIIELILFILFKFTNQTSETINNWYNKLEWTAVILDVLSIIIGFYLTMFIYQYLLMNNYINKNNEFIKFLLILLIVQIIHDISFYFFVIEPTPLNKNKVINEFKEYANRYKLKAVVADSLRYIFATPLLYYFITKYPDNINTFISIVCTYLVSYLLYQTPTLYLNIF